MKEIITDFILAADLASLDLLEAALKRFKALKEVKSNDTVEISLTKVIKPIGLGMGQRVTASDGKTQADWLNRLATDEKAAVRCMACFVLGEFGRAEPSSVVKLAHKLAADDRWEVRECIANAFDDQIGVAHPEFVYDLMSQWVADPSPNVRRVPTNALMRYGIRNPRKVIALMDKLRRDESEYVRKNVRFCLQQIAKEKHPILGAGNADNPDVMLATLREWANDTNKHNRWIVAGTLGNVWAKNRVKPAIEILRLLASDGNKLVRGAVVASMRELAKWDADAVKAAAETWAKNRDENVKRAGEQVNKKLN
ncbi:MAG TPA: HEAT repeat domain-containing protein [Anaerolineales bacterium]|nr:HEAT repeat domain-containing protein [Anaerolineales bacterium]